jgi:hypothetical protein
LGCDPFGTPGCPRSSPGHWWCSLAYAGVSRRRTPGGQGMWAIRSPPKGMQSPGAPETSPKCGGLSPPHFGMVSGAPGDFQIPQITVIPNGVTQDGPVPNSGYLKALWLEFCGSVSGIFSAKLGLYRRGSSCRAGCTKHQLGILSPLRGAKENRPDCLQVPSHRFFGCRSRVSSWPPIQIERWRPRTKCQRQIP